MAKKIKGTLNVGKTAYSNGKSVVTSLNGVTIDGTNGFTVDSYTTDQVLNIISVLPVSNFVMNSGLVTASNFVVNFNSVNPVLLSGNYLELPVSSIDLSTVVSNPASTTFYVYVEMSQGLAQYTITDTVVAESGTSAYNLLWIGTITTNTTAVSSINVISRSRLDVYSPSATAAGSSFPVSTGFPSQSGTISW